MTGPGNDLRDLYREVILDHSRHPRSFGPLPAANREAEGNNPLCGDRVRVFLDLQGDRVAGISFQGAGCAISTASASLMTEVLQGKTLADARAVFADFHRLVTQGDEAAAERLGKLAAFAGVREFPMRVKCATLPWHTFEAALAAAGAPEETRSIGPTVSTETP